MLQLPRVQGARVDGALSLIAFFGACSPRPTAASRDVAPAAQDLPASEQDARHDASAVRQPDDASANAGRLPPWILGAPAPQSSRLWATHSEAAVAAGVGATAAPDLRCDLDLDGRPDALYFRPAVAVRDTGRGFVGERLESPDGTRAPHVVAHFAFRGMPLVAVADDGGAAPDGAERTAASGVALFGFPAKGRPRMLWQHRAETWDSPRAEWEFAPLGDDLLRVTGHLMVRGRDVGRVVASLLLRTAPTDRRAGEFLAASCWSPETRPGRTFPDAIYSCHPRRPFRLRDTETPGAPAREVVFPAHTMVWPVDGSASGLRCVGVRCAGFGTYCEHIGWLALERSTPCEGE